MNLYLLWLVGDIVDVSKVQPLHLLLRPVRRVSRQIVHEEAQPLSFVLRSQILTINLELVDVDRLGEDLEVLDALLFGDATQQGRGGLVQLVAVDSHVGLLVRPLGVGDGLPGEHRLVDVDNSEALVPGHG